MKKPLIVLIIMPENPTRIDPENTGLTEWRYADGRRTFIRYNDTHHLTAGTDYAN